MKSFCWTLRQVLLVVATTAGVVCLDDNIVTSIDLSHETHLKLNESGCSSLHQFMCKDGLKCIEKYQVCDWSLDCFDGSDEESCPLAYPCRNGTFKCRYSKKCIPTGWLCDGSVDCGLNPTTFEQDDSDEQDPSCKAENICSPNQFLCMDGVTCIKISNLCDSTPQCPGREDEHKFCTVKSICSDAPCKYGCKPSPAGQPVCYCPDGQEHDGKNCVESNECSEEGACDQMCTLDDRKKKSCKCAEGYRQNGTHCKAENDQGLPLLLYQDTSHIGWLHLNGSSVKAHPSYESESHGGLLGLDFDHLNHTVCWISHVNELHSMRCGKDTNLRQYWVKPQPYLYSFEDVHQLSFDWIGSNYYFVDEAMEIIFVCKQNLVFCKTVIDTGITKPRGIAVDPTKGFIFFTFWGRKGAKLERASMDGTNRYPMVDSKIVYPYGITVDLASQKVYWVDKFLDSIERIDYDRKNRRTIHRGTQLLQDITVFENFLYFTSVHDNSIKVIQKFQPPVNATVLKSELKKPFTVRVYHRVKQPRVKHPCPNHMGCSDFCFPLWKNKQPIAKCSCREGYVLHSDGKSEHCVAADSSFFMIYAKAHSGIIRGIDLKIENSDATELMVPVIQKSSDPALAYDSQTSNLFYSDTLNFKIMQKKLHDVRSSVFLDSDIGYVTGMAVDWHGRNLYFVDESVKAIYVVSLKNPKLKSLLIHSNLTHPKSIAISPPLGLLFWSNYGTNGKDGSIEKAWMDGSHRRLIAQNLGWPIGLTIDSENRFLYWLDALQFTVQRIKLSIDDTTASKKETLLKANITLYGDPTDFTYFNGSIYVAAEGKVIKAAAPTAGNLDVGNQLKSVIQSHDDVSHFILFDSSQQQAKGRCTSNNGCQDFCFATPVKPGYVCGCREGYSISKDGKLCEPLENFVSPLTCKLGEFRCKKFPRCIPDRMRCNNADDCGDGSDEDSDICDKDYINLGLCGRNSFHCGNGSNICIPLRMVCDGKADCPDGSDEKTQKCANSSSPIRCSEFEFQCKVSKRCIPKSWVCDGESDCGSSDTSDEHDECVYPDCSRLQFSCGNSSGALVCIPLESVCDGFQDCPGIGLDESNCEFHCNSSGKVLCKPDHKCLFPEEICDSKCDCSDASDELKCPDKLTPPDCVLNLQKFTDDFTCEIDEAINISKEECYNVTCGRHSFKCNSGDQCIHLWGRCNGQPNCKDGSDELDCPKKSVYCPFPSRLCDEGTKCLNISQICDGKIDCNDKSDEGKLCSSASENPCIAANCSYHCARTPDGHVCYCPPNMFVSPKDKSLCLKDHPCEHFGTCSQICWKIDNTQHQCLCRQGYALKDDGFNCTSLSSESPYLVFSNRHELRGLQLNNTASFHSLISNLRNSIALDFYYNNGKYDVFWSDVVDDRIYRGSLVGGVLINLEIVVKTGLATAEGLAVDWIGENIYWVESNLDQIEVAKLDGKYRETLISGNMVSPRSISVDPNVGLLFWSDWQTEAPRIERASMSGKFREVVFRVGKNGEGAWPNGLTLDLDLERVYWVDARLDSIHTIKYDGSDFQTVLSQHPALSHPFSITLFESSLVWTDWRSNSVMKANKFNGQNVVVIHKTYTQPFDVKVLHQTRQPRRIENPCGNNNGGCSHLCLLSINQTLDCGCPHLMTLSSDNKTCIANEKMLLFSRLNEIRAVYFDKSYYHAAPPISYPLIIAPANLHFVAKYKQIYWSDSQSGDTKRASISNNTLETLIDSAAGKPLAIGVDWISNLIFIALQSPSKTSISVTDLDGEYFCTIIQREKGLKNINSIAVNPYTAHLFWPDGNSPNNYSIQTALMDGTKQKALTTNRDNPMLENPASLSYDFKSDRLYWINFNTEKIQYYDFRLSAVKTITFTDVKPHVITVYENFIFFASEKQDAILKGDKTLGGKSEIVRNNTENIFSIRVYDPEEQKGTNPCAVNKGGCMHLCLPVSTIKRVCKCALGYVPNEEDPTRCKTIETILIYSDSSGMKGVNPISDSNDDSLVPIPLVSYATDIDIHEATEHLYWVDNEKGKVCRIKRDGTGKETVLADLEGVNGLAIDWIAENMYWGNPKDGFIEVSHLNGSSHYVLITEDVEKPMSIAVDPVRGFLFWTDVQKSRIERSTLDGANRIKLVTNERAADLAVDVENQKVYWCDASYDKIESMNYDGSDRKTVHQGTPDSHLHSPIINNGVLYWIDMGHTGGSLMAASIKNFNKTYPVRKDIGVTIKDLTVYGRGRQNGSNPCGIRNGGCDDLCFWNGTHPVCVCAHGKLSDDGRSCEPYDAFIAFSKVNSIETAHVGHNVTPNYPYAAIQSTEHIRNAIGLAFDYKRNTLFYSDVQLGTVNSVLFNGTNFGVVAEKQGSVEGLYFEASHLDLYWTCSNDASINRLNPYDKSAKVEKIVKLTTHDKPRGISVDPCESRVYWTNWDSNRPSIQRAYLSGYHIESIIVTEIRMPNSLALDHAARKLYWVDARLDKIERAELDGTNRKIIARDKPKHAFSLAVYKDFIIWSDWVQYSIMRANKYTGEDVTVLRKDIPKPMAIVAVASQEDVCSLNPCTILNGGCTDLCTLDEHATVVCKCNPGKVLLSDGRCTIDTNARVNCSSLEFSCDNGGCIPYSLSCDGVSHCPDSSDEEVKYCATRQCRKGFFKCASTQRCIPDENRCNSISECPEDDSDELNCTCNPDKHFKCNDGRCIPIEKKCDQHADCKDLSDEQRASCGPVICSKEFYQCPNTTVCISKMWECDGQNDCMDNSDEANCRSAIIGARNSTDRTEECQPNSFQCDDGQCILSAWKCDGDHDCESGEDEPPDCNHKKFCGPHQFRCADGACVSESLRCDGIQDCQDGSDESETCEAENCHPEKQFQCNSTGRCIDAMYVCDGDFDCKNGEDESLERCEDSSNRTSVLMRPCSAMEFRCNNGACVPRTYVCDSDHDCSLGEDETNCKPHACIEGDLHHFKCKNGKCIPISHKCNGVPDCADESDEDPVLCEAEYCKSDSQYLCKNGVCINETKLCNGEDDCGDYTDEVGCSINECDFNLGARVCEHGCTDKKVGYECYCFDGYEVSEDDPRSCRDIDECSARKCSQTCKNSLGSYKCSCWSNYILKADQHSCKANSSDMVQIMFTNQYYIRIVDEQGGVYLLAQNLTNAVALDFQWNTGCVYWSDVTSQASSIKRQCTKSGNSNDFGKGEANQEAQTIHHVFTQMPDGLAVDWIANNLYWCDKGSHTIEVSKVDGRFRKVLVPNLQDPRAIALDPFRGYMYWTDWGDEPVIGKAGMDGTRLQIIIDDNMGWPNALTISLETEELWWADAKEDYIAVADLHGKNRKIVHSRSKDPNAKVHHIFSLTVFEDWLYWSDWETKTVEKCHKYDGTNQTTVSNVIHRPMDVKVFHPFRQPPRPDGNPCENDGGCQNLCLLSPDLGGKVCACPENFVLNVDGKSCRANCSSSQFVCHNSSKCIQKWWKCDTQADCEDREDEPENCPPFHCQPGQVQFEDRCLSPTSLCDGKRDAKDGEDEEDCENFACLATQFKCPGNATIQSICIPIQKRCDGTTDCVGGSDEADCAPAECPVNLFKCKAGGKCLQQEWLCDLEKDCPDGSDEGELANCTTRQCDLNKFQCHSGKCIPESWKCDGDNDCSEGEDEKFEHCNKPITCDPTYHRCNNSQKCIPSRWKCDFEPDCPEGDDELGCVPRNCSEVEFKCGDGRCIHSKFRCDSEFQCYDHTDEENCNMTCSSNELLCQQPQTCLPGSFKCDGEWDCLDGSDEVGCRKSACDGFACSNGECISKSWVCDGEKDCVAGEDEETDMCAKRVCEPGRFRCQNNICIPYSATCNWIDDCKDGSDERPGMCSTHKASSCSVSEFECTADSKCIHESLVCDGSTQCIDGSDEVECPICPFGFCPQLCFIRKHNHYSCECLEGFYHTHEGNSSHCIAQGKPAYLIIASDDRLNQLSKPNDKEISDLIPASTSISVKIDSIDHLMEKDGSVQLFWTSRSSKTIQTMFLPAEPNSIHSRTKRATEVTDIITGLDEPRGIAVDWITRTIYWVDAGLKTLSVSSLDGKNRMVLFNKHISEPHDIVVDPESGRLYWSDWLDQRIDYALMAGGGRKTVVHSPCPSGLAIDYPARRLYFTDIKSHTIESTTMEGKDRRVIQRFSTADLKPHKIDVFESTLYLTAYNSNKLFRLDKFGKGNASDITQGVHKASDVIVLHAYKQLHYDNPCLLMNCPSPSLCLRNGSKSAVCVCPNGAIISKNRDGHVKNFECNTTVDAVCDLKCKAMGSCLIESNGPVCKCTPLYEGPRCERYRCSGYCQNKGLCYPDAMASLEDDKVPLKCQCSPNYTGERCEIKIETCHGLCRNGGTCNNATNVCICPIGFRGRLCTDCDQLSCENEGVCTKDGRGKPACHCPAGYSGNRCEKSACSGYCKNKGKCKVKDGVPTCECLSGFRGSTCEEDTCSDFCRNGGTCERTAKGAICNCTRPFSGVTCEINLCAPKYGQLPTFCKNGSTQDLCKNFGCSHGGSCEVINQKAYCRCHDSWIGHHCELEAPIHRPCLAYCLNNGLCVLANQQKTPECKCLGSWSGPRCQIKTACQSTRCFHGGICTPNPDPSLSPTCKCLPGYHGLRCEDKDYSEKMNMLPNDNENGFTWIIVLVFILVALSVASLSGCLAYLVMRRKEGRPFMHRRMQDSGTVEISNPMFLKDDGDDDHASEPSLIFDSDKVLLQGTNFTNPVYETMYKEGESSGANDEKKGLLQGEDFSSSGDHPLADPLA